ncbi:MAG TPA: PaaI family thioesterase [Acidimicrobiales bacterium]|nr:PaaI family thioesterase [Acidimicrobiales bacterium]
MPAPGAELAMEMEVTPKVVNGAGVLLGGLMATLADMAAGSLLMRGAPPGQRYTTRDLHITFLAPVRRGPVRAVARVLRRGERSAVVRVEVHDGGDGDRHVASATLSFASVPVSGERVSLE